MADVDKIRSRQTTGGQLVTLKVEMTSTLVLDEGGNIAVCPLSKKCRILLQLVHAWREASNHQDRKLAYTKVDVSGAEPLIDRCLIKRAWRLCDLHPDALDWTWAVT